MSRHAYPRPQLRRNEWQSLDGTWRFAYDDANAWRLTRDIDDWPMRIEVPYPPESAASGIGDTGLHAALWCQREFDCAADRTIRTT